jgi:hypothetical protein
MLIYDGVYAWKGFGGLLKLASGQCRLRLYDLSRDPRRVAAILRPFIAIVSDVPESRMSVRSCTGHVATSVARDFKIDPQRMLYIEYYPESVYGEHQDRVIPERYEAVDFNWTEGGAIQPRWRTLKPPLLDAIQRLLHGKHRKDHGAPDGV